MSKNTLRRMHVAAERFSNAAQQYDDAAYVQKQAAALFDTWLSDLKLDSPRRIAEIGCGTGLLTQRLHARFPDAFLEATDLAPAMVEFCRHTLPENGRIRYRVCDGRNARFDPSPDWIVSAMCFQWLPPLRPVLQHHLEQCDVLAFSLVLDGSFTAWRAAHEQAGIEPGLRPCPAFDALLADCHSLGAAQVHAQRVTLTQRHADGLDFARSLRAIGADLSREGHLPANLRPVLRQLRHGFDADYDIGFFCIRR